ncbi:hypothetical protein BBP40_005361 [Aspergillus hancockii]|nr:hypothetical protein BBP40_005361 [Aspergillus hancockii]
MGAGFGGLLFAGFTLEDIVIVDTATGYIYMPLLEETGYIPKNKYAYGDELREYTICIAKRWSLEDRVMFRAQLQRCSWNEDAAEWLVEMTQYSAPGRCD